jgi:hypothetical protein
MLGVGPMSKRIVEETIKLANECKRPIALIPSRRQVECRKLGGGYAESWTTEDFALFVRKRDIGNFIYLSRDHSGPWQLSTRNKMGEALSHREAMEEVKISLSVDIESGFDILHIDPSMGLGFNRSEYEVLEDVIELFDFCTSHINSTNQIFEIGADEQSMVPDLPSIAEYKLKSFLEMLNSAGLGKPMFYVLQTGTKVMEMRNVGSFATHVPVRDMLAPAFQIPEIMKICSKYGIYLKEHNADYLPNESLSWHRRFAIPAANVAPEFGVTETRSILKLARENNQTWFVDRFSSHVLEGMKWEKWLMTNSSATDQDKVEIAGHYHFSDREIQDLIGRLTLELKSKQVNFEDSVRHSVRSSISRYLFYFGYYD